MIWFSFQISHNKKPNTTEREAAAVVCRKGLLRSRRCRVAAESSFHVHDGGLLGYSTSACASSIKYKPLNT